MSRRVVQHNPVRRLAELFDASALGVVTLLLLAASFYATFRGMQDFVASRAAGGGVGTTGLVVLVVLTLTLAMYVALREMVNPIRWRNVFIAFPLYALLALWSVGFGYGFWWSLVAGQNATEAALERTVTSLGETTSGLRAELAAGAALMGTAERLSEEKAQREIERGGTCGVASGAGDGPLSRARAETRSQIAALAVGVEANWLVPVEERLSQLEASAGAGEVAGEDAEARKQRMVALGQSVRRAAQDISADATVRGKILAEQLRAKAERLSVAPVSGAVAYCYDPDLATSLLLVAEAIEGPFEIEVTAFRFAEGADGVAQAVEDLWLGVFARLGLVEGAGVPVRPDGRGLVALMAAIGVDLALFVFALLRGGKRRPVEMVAPPVGPAGEVIDGGGAVQAALPSPETPDKKDDPDIKDAEFVEKPNKPDQVQARPTHRVVETSAADVSDQSSPEEQLERLLRQVQISMAEIDAATKTSSRIRPESDLATALRQLKKIGYEMAGMDEKSYVETLHKIHGEEESDRPSGTIIRIVRPRFIRRADGDIIRAWVIVSIGR